MNYMQQSAKWDKTGFALYLHSWRDKLVETLVCSLGGSSPIDMRAGSAA